MLCLLCGSAHLHDVLIQDKDQSRLYFECATCELTFLDPNQRLSADEERKRYDLHVNDVQDQGYQNFVEKLVSQVRASFDKHHCGLDFGSGPNSVVSYLLKSDHYNLKQYDPFFSPDTKILQKKNYDYVIVCEVAEHFYNPKTEFNQLKDLLKDTGSLFLFTQLRTKQLDFKNWYYRRDVTHVCFYSEKTFEYLKECLGFKSLDIIKPNFIKLTQ